MPADLYLALRIQRGATPADIKKAYRQIARQYHPDKNPDDENAKRVFTEAAEAYRVLGDEELRRQYDSTGRTSPPRAASKAAPKRAPEDVFNDIFGGPARANRAGKAERGPDLKYTLRLDLEEAAFGCERKVTVSRHRRCVTCVGTGAKSGSTPVLCQPCSGTGEVRSPQGFFNVNKPCPACSGAGRLIADACDACRGSGTHREKKLLTVSVPAGVDDGTRLRMAGEGDIGSGGGPSGDLFVVVEMKAHPFFVKEGAEVACEVPVRLDQAALGATVEVPTLEGKVRMRIPAGSQPGRVFRLKGKGLPNADGAGRGDQRVRLLVEIPEHVSSAQKELLERWAKLEVEHDANPLVRDFRRQMDTHFAPRH